jgi:predicted secreted protein
MSDEESTMNRFQTAGKDYQDSLDSQDGKDGKSSKDVKDNGGIKEQRESFQAYIPADDKGQIEEVWRKVKALFSLSDREEPPKNDFYAAVLKHGYTNLEGIADHLDVSESYEQHKEMIK